MIIQVGYQIFNTYRIFLKYNYKFKKTLNNQFVTSRLTNGSQLIIW
jgi:hypothetical protein